MEEPTQPQFRSGLPQSKPDQEMGFQSDQFNFMSTPPLNSTSFTALLELPPPQAVQLLVKEDFPSNFPVPNFSTLDSMKQEPLNSDPGLDPDPDPKPDSSTPNQSKRCTKRKGKEKKVNELNKKGKRVEGTNEEDEKLPYVHVRARRGQATDSHSLAERARREKINARMKLLQELVPGCKKISGTAMVLDEIINHVQALQRQVEFLSMRLAAVEPRINFNLDAFLAAENGSSIDNSYTEHIWPEGQTDGIRHQEYQQLLNVDGLHQPSWGKDEEDTSNFISLKEPRSIYDHSANPGSLHSSQLKMEL